jgi:hypothetical protein
MRYLKGNNGRRGVASVVGTIFFVVVFMLALGSLAYASGLQAQASQAEQQALQLDLRRGTEGLVFATQVGGLWATDTGTSSVSITYLVLRFPNGSAYSLLAASTVPAGGRVSVQALVPAGLCSPGSATCLSKYNQITRGNPPGASVGLVTSMGNAFWYTYAGSQVYWSAITAFPQACPTGQSVSQLNTTLTCMPAGALASRVKASVATNGTSDYLSTTLSVHLAANSTYVFYAFTAIEPTIGIEEYNFEVHSLPAGAALVLACAPMASPSGGGNQPTNCVSSTGTPIAQANSLGFGVPPPVYATPGLFGVVSMGTNPGLLQVDFACTAHCGSVSMRAGSFLLVLPSS